MVWERTEIAEFLSMICRADNRFTQQVNIESRLAFQSHQRVMFKFKSHEELGDNQTDLFKVSAKFSGKTSTC